MQLRFVIALMLATACTTNNGGGNPPPADGPPQSQCQSIAGTWLTSGTCGGDTCRMTQAGCAITQVTCDSGAHSTSGTINGAQFSYTGVSGAGVPATCTGTLNGNTLAGSCTVNGVQCSVTGNRP